MKLKDISNIRQSDPDFANLFNIYSNTDGQYVYNINRTLYFKGTDNMLPSIYNLYIIKFGDTWTKIAYDNFGSIEYWWLICKFNGIINPVDLPIEGEVIKIPTTDIAKKIIDSLKTQ